MGQRLLNLEEAAQLTNLPVTILEHYTELGLIGPVTGYTDENIRELRCVRRMIDDMGLQQEAVEIVLRMRQRILALEQERQHLVRELHIHRTQSWTGTWIEAEWHDSLA